MTSIAIIGAGLSGLTLAAGLKPRANVWVFEKSRGVGGRMATRRAGAFQFDHGAQYFTAKTGEFQKGIESFVDTGTIAPWPVSVASLNGAQPAGREMFVAAPGMNAMCKSLASGLDIRLTTHIEQIIKTGDQWTLRDSNAQTHGPFDWIVSTAPAPQTAALLPEPLKGRDALQSVSMQGCFSLMLGFEHAPVMPWTAARIGDSPVGWMALNSAKPGRESPASIVIQSSNDWAEAHLEEPREDIEALLISEASKLCQADLSHATHAALHRWRYASTSVTAGTPFLLDEHHQLAACGDWCLGSRVEAAFLSASKLRDAMLEQI